MLALFINRLTIHYYYYRKITDSIDFLVITYWLLVDFLWYNFLCVSLLLTLFTI